MKTVGSVGCCSPAASLGAWGAATRLCACSAASSLLDRVIAPLRPQVEALVLNANGDPARFAGFGLPVVADTVPDFAGPLAGVLAGLDWAAVNRPDCPYVASVATDAPFLPQDLVAGSQPRSKRPAPISPAPRRAAGRTRCSDCGRCGCAKICAAP